MTTHPSILGREALDAMVEYLSDAGDIYRSAADQVQREADRHRGEPGHASQVSVCDNLAAELRRKADESLHYATIFEFAEHITVETQGPVSKDQAPEPAKPGRRGRPAPLPTPLAILGPGGDFTREIRNGTPGVAP